MLCSWTSNIQKWPVKLLVLLLFVISTSRKRNLPVGQSCYIKPALYLLALTREAFCGCVSETHLSARTDVHFVGGVEFRVFLLRLCCPLPGLKSINLVRYRVGVRPPPIPAWQSSVPTSIPLIDVERGREPFRSRLRRSSLAFMCANFARGRET